MMVVVGVTVFVVASLLSIAAFNVWYQNSYKSLLQTLEAPGEKLQFVLLTDVSGSGDRTWYVYQMPIGTDPTNQMETGHDTEGALFWNHSEAGDHYDNPKIEILNERYLVFSRGRLYHSLYDLGQKAVLVNDQSPWNSFRESEQFKKYGDKTQPGTTGAGMDVWVRDNLHRKIENIVNGTT